MSDDRSHGQGITELAVRLVAQRQMGARECGLVGIQGAKRGCRCHEAQSSAVVGIHAGGTERRPASDQPEKPLA